MGGTDETRVPHDSKDMLQRVIDAAPVALWAVDTEGIITLSVGRGLAALGVKPGQLVGQCAYELYRDVPETSEAIRFGLTGQEFSNKVEVGGCVLETMFSPLRDATGAITGLLGISIDVTARHRAEQDRERLQAQLLQVQKLESLGLLAGGIAHDFNNILAAILGGASAALHTLSVDAPARQDVANIMHAAQRAVHLTRQMLAYSGKGHVEIGPIDLSFHVHEIATLLETTVPKKAQLRLELKGGLPAIEADIAQVQQIVMNLVINGAEAIGDQSGTLLVTTGMERLGEVHAPLLFAAEGFAAGDYVFLEVQDTGHGMDAATQAKIFDPFFTTKFAGRGLGLAAVLGIVRGHRGAIQVHSTPEKGTTFKVFFPTSTSPAAPRRRDAAIDYRGTGLVLVVDDDSGVRHATCRMLEFFGFSTLQAADGRQGAELFTAHADTIVLVILDMTMPKMNGEETFRAIRRIRADAPVILMSGYSEFEATRNFRARGLAGFLEKPFTSSDLAAKLASVKLPARK